MANKKENPNRHEFSITVDGKEWKDIIQQAYNEISKTKTVDGFRKGKAPKEVYDKKFGKESYMLEAANHAVSSQFTKIMGEHHYQLVAEPQIHITTLDDEKLEFTMTLVELPEVKVKKYTGLGIQKEDVSVSDEDVEHELSHLLERFSEFVIKDGAVENGDIAVIDYEGFVDGTPFDGGKDENYSLEIGSGHFIPGFEEQVIGMKKDEEKEIHVTFPEDYHAEELKGKDATFKVLVHEVKEKQDREMDEEFFEDLALEGINSEESLKQEIRKSLEAQKETDAENRYIDHIIEEVSKNTEVDIPEEMVYDVVDNMFEDFKQRLAMQGISLEIYEQFTKQSEEDIKSEMEKTAFSRVLARLTLEEIAKLEKITVTDEEVEERLQKIVNETGMKKEEVIKEIGNLDVLKYDLEMNKVIEFLKDANK